jgi:hypothetical protein
MAKIKGKERAIIIAQLAMLEEQKSHHARWSVKNSIDKAEEVLTAAEDFVAEKYGEFR